MMTEFLLNNQIRGYEEFHCKVISQAASLASLTLGANLRHMFHNNENVSLLHSVSCDVQRIAE